MPMSQAEAFVSIWMAAILNGSDGGAASASRGAIPGTGAATSNTESDNTDAGTRGRNAGVGEWSGFTSYWIMVSLPMMVMGRSVVQRPSPTLRGVYIRHLTGCKASTSYICRMH